MTQRFLQLRKEYLQQTLSEGTSSLNPFKQFEKWFDEAVNAEVAHPDAMTLATVSPEGSPDARIVLLRGINDEGFSFFTNYCSAKGRQLEINYSAILLMFWPDLERQIRVKGEVCKASAPVSDAYFATRPRGAQISAIASPQSEVIESREWLEREISRVTGSFDNQEIARPKTWGGYTLSPHEFEFWQGRENRAHDRLRYRKDSDGVWVISRLAP